MGGFCGSLRHRKRRMINWSKPIETMDGREARRLIGPINAEFHCVYTLPDPESCGSKHDVFLVDHEGVRCDDRAIYSKRQKPFIRNVKVKKEGWVLMRPSSASMDGRYLADDRVYASEAEAESAKANWYGADPGVKPVHITWEE
jgi:hypothetical protein